MMKTAGRDGSSDNSRDDEDSEINDNESDQVDDQPGANAVYLQEMEKTTMPNPKLMIKNGSDLQMLE